MMMYMVENWLSWYAFGVSPCMAWKIVRFKVMEGHRGLSFS